MSVVHFPPVVKVRVLAGRDPPPCPCCGSEQFLYWDEATEPEFVCPECIAWLDALEGFDD